MRLPDTGRACHPKVRPSSIRHYVLDEIAITAPTTGPATDIVRGAQAVTVGTKNVPTVIPACQPRARRWQASVQEAIAEAAADAEVVAALLEECTVGVLFRTNTTGFTPGTLFALSGPAADPGTDPTNYVRAFRMTSAGALDYFWEHSAAGTNITAAFADYVVRPFEWTYAVFRVRDVTGVGPAGSVTIDLFVNGVVVDSQSAVVNASGGSSSVLRIGHELNADGVTIDANANVDIAGVYVWAEALAEDEIEEDARRIRRLPFFTRHDIAVKTSDANGIEKELTDLEGMDFVDAVEIIDEIDQPTIKAKVTLIRESEMLSMASLKTDSKINLEDPFDPTSYVAPFLREDAPIEVFAARVPLGLRATPEELALGSEFRGAIDDIDEGGEQVILDCRDDGGRLIDTMIEQEVLYGGDPPVAVEGEMQFILNDNDSDAGNNSVGGLTARTGSYSPITLHTPVSPGWAVRTWRQRREGVLAALRTLAGQWGGECRYKYDQDPAQRTWRLTHYEPDRARVDVDVVIDPDEVIDVQSLKRSTFGRRTNVRIVYPSSETSAPVLPTPPAGYTVTNGWQSVDGDGNRLVAYVEVQSDVAIAATRKRQYMDVQEQQSAQVDTIAEAYDMAFGILRDVEDVGLAKTITMPLMCELERNDMLRFRPIQHLFTAPQTMAVRQFSKSYGDRSTVSVQLRGKPSVGFKRWLRMEARGGNRPGIIDPANALTDLTTGTLLEVYRNLLDRSSYFTGGKFTQLRNPDFGSFSAGLGNAPDGWHMSVGTWGTDITLEQGIQLSGGKAIRLMTATAAITSDLVPVLGDIDFPHSFEVSWQWPTPPALPGTPKRVELAVEWIAADSVTVVGTDILRPGRTFAAGAHYNFADVTVAGNTWYRSRVDGVRPTLLGTARYARITVRPSTDGAQSMPTGGIIVDTVSMYRTAREDRTFSLNPYNASTNNVWGAVNLRAPGNTPVLGTHDWGHNHFVTAGGNAVIQREDGSLETVNGGNTLGSGFYCKEPGTYIVTAQVLVQFAPTAAFTTMPMAAARVVKNGTYNNVGVDAFATGGTVVAQASGGQWVLMATYDASLTPIGINPNWVSSVQIVCRVELNRGDRLSLEFYRDATVGGTRLTHVNQSAEHTWWNVRIGLAE